MHKRFYAASSLFALVATAIIASCPAQAAPARSSFSSPVRVAPRPMPQRPVAAPAPRVVNKTTNNTTVIRETRVVQAAPQRSSGSGWFGNMAASAGGALAGTMIGNWLSKPEQPQPQLAPPVEHAQPTCDATIYNCEKKVK